MQDNSNLNLYIEKLSVNKNLSVKEAKQAMRIIMSDKAPASEKAAFLTTLQKKGPVIEEIASFADTIRQMAEPVDLTGIPSGSVLIDTCGTGAGGIDTFNISTAIIFILSAAGLFVAKHGNRAITSKCGSADVLEQLEVDISMPPLRASRCLAEIGIAFFYAPIYHGAFKNVQTVRRAIASPTVFNILGPLLNPAFASLSRDDIKKVQVLGVNNPVLTKKMAGVLKLLKLNRALVVYGYDRESPDGMDEISTIGDTQVSELMQTGEIKDYLLNPQDFRVKLAKAVDLTGGTPEQNTRILLDILDGKDRGPRRDIVLLNAAAGLYLGGKAEDLKEGIKLAVECIDSGRARKKLESLRQFSQKKQ